ncbi:hypothetical protein PWT90_07806 [Aphanocladium album]|nr:hypothetical protein PWT90_07806 [Aphanocladium album]
MQSAWALSAARANAKVSANVPQSDARQNSDDAIDSWANSVGFALTDAPEDADATIYPFFIAHQSLHERMHCLIRHRTACGSREQLVPHSAPQILQARRRLLAQGSSLSMPIPPLPPALVPPIHTTRRLRTLASALRSSHAPNRPRNETSGSTSPPKQADGEADNDCADMTAPASLNIEMDAVANNKVNEFPQGVHR